MKIGFYNPYLDNPSGGERYTLALASHWSEDHDVCLFWDDTSIIKKARERLNIDLSKTKIVQNVFRGKNVFKKISTSLQYDLIFFLSDGSIPTTLAKHNLLHFQVPFSEVAYSPFKLSRYQYVVCNSRFTQNHLDRRVRNKTIVIYPPVRPVPQEPKIKKDKIILSVGRFTGYHNVKKQEVMIDAFKKIENHLSDWKLVLAGGLIESDRDYFRQLKDQSKNHRIELLSNFNFQELVKLYQQAPIYWHAAGFDETDPTLMEHFGISTVEAMSAGAMPIVFAGGGQTEVVEDGKNGFLWKTVEELINNTLEVAGNMDNYEEVRQSAMKRSRDFSEEKFAQKFDELLKQLQ
ncbi:glycosyltransferase family 4 protein [Patescibacteria group bacterium]|nr:glycosyltransferase family 4 protein [Patescibacteria group bacterium]MBU1472751.1 glycosyltransferase family 4 protein [Patescibacteria group bacterium]MBU2460017.1 glycosyltransferase family 4 protein [Patescibacteria group bacterium]MBU2544325.1 glycosyltransferase family 4 protein [Patescibacteria group bacterium]